MGKMLEEISFALDQKFAAAPVVVVVLVVVVIVVVVVVIVFVGVMVVAVDLMTPGMMGMAI